MAPSSTIPAMPRSTAAVAIRLPIAAMSSVLFAAAAKPGQPKHFNELLESMPASHIVVVFGEEDNAFEPPH